METEYPCVKNGPEVYLQSNFPTNNCQVGFEGKKTRQWWDKPVGNVNCYPNYPKESSVVLTEMWLDKCFVHIAAYLVSLISIEKFSYC